MEQILAEPSEFDAWIVAIRDRLAAKDVKPEDLEVAAWLVIEMVCISLTHFYANLHTFAGNP